MSFQPVVPLSGYVGWRFLARTAESQQATFAKSQPVTRATDYFRDKIADVRNAADLVEDRQLLSVALGAFGLDDDIDNKFFIRKILEDGTSHNNALANRLTDNRYAEFSKAFGFLAKNETSRQGDDQRLPPEMKYQLADIVDQNTSDRAQWFAMMGNASLRNVFESALGLSPSIATIDIDLQRDIFRTRAQSVFGTDKLADFTEKTQQEKLARIFLSQEGPSTPTVVQPDFVAKIIARYEKQQFEKAVGMQNGNLRLALNLESGLENIVGRNSKNGAQWFSVIGNTPLRKVFETALGLPSSIASIDIDRQREIFQTRSRSVFGTDVIADFTKKEQQEKLIRLFLIRSEAARLQTSSGSSAALTLLQSAPRYGRRM